MPRKVTVKVNNINLIFNKLYYEQLAPGNSKQFEEDVKKKNEMIFLQKFKDSDFSACQELEEHFGESFKKFRLKTDYPGLLIGTGNPHGSGAVASDIKCGFSFSYVTGQPYLPSSGVKGILRSSFAGRRPAVIDFLSKILENESICDKDIEELDKDIFEGSDIFLDALDTLFRKHFLNLVRLHLVNLCHCLEQKPDEESESDTYHQDLARSDLRVPFHSAPCNAPKRHRNFRRE